MRKKSDVKTSFRVVLWVEDKIWELSTSSERRGPPDIKERASSWVIPCLDDDEEDGIFK